VMVVAVGSVLSLGPDAGNYGVRRGSSG